MSDTARRQEPCGHEDCGSRRFHVGDDGFTYCHRGHQQLERGTVIAEDTEELVIHGHKSRRTDSDVESGTGKGIQLSGPRAYEHYILCLQLILRKQVRWLIDAQRLPEELEALVRDLWVLRLRKVQSRISYEHETDTEAPSQVFTSQSERETTDTEPSRTSQRGRGKPPDGTPDLLDALSISYIGLLLLREPVTVGDFHHWISEGRLLYYGAVREIPLEMKRPLPSTYHIMLEPQILLSAWALHQKVLGLLRVLDKDYGMAVPPINHTLILYRWTRELLLPIEVFPATQRLAKMLGFDFSFSLRAKARPNPTLGSPEARLMAILLVATKLLFPFDDIERLPSSASGLSALSLDWTLWSEVRTGGVQAPSRFTPEMAMMLSETEALHLADKKLDDYLEWYEKSFANEEVREHGQVGKDADLRRTMFRLFPVTSQQQEAGFGGIIAASSDESDVLRLRKMQSTLKPKRLVPEDAGEQGVRRLGSYYRRFKSEEDLDGPVKVVYQQAAKLAAITVHQLVQAVLMVEESMHKREEKLRKGRKS